MAVDYHETINEFINTQSLANGSANTYAHNLSMFLDFLGEKKFTRSQVARYIKTLQGNKKKDRYIALQLTVIRRYAKYLWEEDRLQEKEYKKINGYKVKLDLGEDNRRVLTPEEEKLGYQLIANPILRMLYWTGLHYGLRRSEYINLQLNDVDLKKRILIIKKSKGNKTRRVKILKTHVSTWNQWFKTRAAYQLNHEHVFFTDRGKAGTRTLERYFNKISELIHNKPFKGQSETERITSHTLRYTFAVKCWRGGMDLLVLSKILGHTSLTTTQKYLRVAEEEILEKYEEQASRIL
ncbi:MAG: tyrosine-type recombinase/integrase [Candidatus Hodarchaeota archaeon]